MAGDSVPESKSSGGSSTEDSVLEGELRSDARSEIRWIEETV